MSRWTARRQVDGSIITSVHGFPVFDMEHMRKMLASSTKVAANTALGVTNARDTQSVRKIPSCLQQPKEHLYAQDIKVRISRCMSGSTLKKPV